MRELSLLKRLQERFQYELIPIQEWTTQQGEMGVYKSTRFGAIELVIALSSESMVIRTYRSPESALEDARIIAAFACADKIDECEEEREDVTELLRRGDKTP